MTFNRSPLSFETATEISLSNGTVLSVSSQQPILVKCLKMVSFFEKLILAYSMFLNLAFQIDFFFILQAGW